MFSNYHQSAILHDYLTQDQNLFIKITYTLLDYLRRQEHTLFCFALQ